MIEIDVALECDAPWADDPRLREAIRRIAADHEVRRGSVSLAVVDDLTIHELNQRYLAHDEPTDALSFVLERRGDLLEGEIIVSADTAARVAATLGCPPADELLLYVVHAALHLVGYDDLDDQSRPHMRRRERDYLAQFGVVLPPVDA